MTLKILSKTLVDEAKQHRCIDFDTLNKMKVYELEEVIDELDNRVKATTKERLRIIANNARGLSLWEHEGFFSRYQTYVPPFSAHHIVLHQVEGGQVRACLSGREEAYITRVNSICILPAYTPIYFEGSGVMHTLHITLSPEFMQGTLRNIDASFDPRMQLGAYLGKQDSITANLMLAMAEYAKASHGLALANLGGALVVHLLENYGVINTKKSTAALSKRQMQLVRDFMMSRLGEIPNLEEISEQLRVTTLTFSRLFKSTTGLTPLEFYRDLRMKRARELVEKSHHSLTEIALDLGFTDSAHFSNAFRKYWKSPPSAFRG